MRKGILISLIAAASLASADTLVLRNGNRVEGNYVGGDTRSVRFAVGNQVSTYGLNDVETIRFSNGQQGYAPGTAYPQNPNANYGPNGNYPANGGYSQTNGGYSQNRPASGYAGSSSNSSMGVEVPSGTELVVRLIDEVNSERDNLGQTYRASIDQPVVVNGQTVIPRGSDVTATLIDEKKSGKIEGRTVLTLDLKSVTLNGRTYNIVTTGLPEASGSRGARSAKVIGGTAALGAIIGAVAGGGRGAAIGAGSGAAVGTAAEVATSGQKVRVPAETRLTFTLQNPLDL